MRGSYTVIGFVIAVVLILTVVKAGAQVVIKRDIIDDGSKALVVTKLQWADPQSGTQNTYSIKKKFDGSGWTDVTSVTDPTNEFTLWTFTPSFTGTGGSVVRWCSDNGGSFLDETNAGSYQVSTSCGFEEEVEESGNGPCEDCGENGGCMSDSTGTGDDGDAGGASSPAIGGPASFSVSYRSNRTAYETDVGYGYTHTWDKRLVKVGTVDNGSNDGTLYEVYLGGSRFKFFEDGDGEYHAYDGSDMCWSEMTVSGSDGLRIWNRNTNRAHAFVLPESDGWDNATKISWEMNVMSQDSGGEPLGYYLSYKYFTDTDDDVKLQYLVNGDDPDDANERLLKFEYDEFGTGEDAFRRLKYVKDPKDSDATIVTLNYNTGADDPHMLNEFEVRGTYSTQYAYHGTYDKKLIEKKRYLNGSDYESTGWSIEYVGQETVNGISDDQVIYTKAAIGDEDGSDYFRVETSASITWTTVDSVTKVDFENSYRLIKEAWKDDSPSGIIYRQGREYFPYTSEEGGEIYTYHKTEYISSSDVQSPEVLKTVLSKYDSTGNLVEKQIQGPNGFYLTTGYQYNEHDDVTKEMTRRSQTLDWDSDTPDKQYVYQYDSTTGRKTYQAMVDGYGVWHVTRYVVDNGFPTLRWSDTYVEYGGVKAQETEYTYYGSGDSNKKFLLWKVKDAKGKETIYDYNNDHTLKSVTDTKGRETEYEYSHSESNSYSQPWKVKRPGANGQLVTEYEYSDLGQITKVTNPPAEVGGTSFITQYTYDNRGRQTVVTQKYGTSVLWTGGYYYDEDSGLLEKTTRTVDSTVYVLSRQDYDYSGAVTKVYNSGTEGETGGDSEVQYVYDQLGDKICDKYKTGDSSFIRWSYSYDPGGMLWTLTNEDDVAIGYTYTDKNLLWTINYPTDSDITYSYNTERTVSSVTDGTYTVSYSYDARGRLTSINDAWGKSIGWTNFDGDTWVATELTYPGHTGNIQYTYNDYGQLTKIRDTYNGNKDTEYTYDPWTDAVMRIDLPNGSHAAYTYDDMGRITRVKNYKSDDTTINQFDYSYKNICACTGGVIDRITFEDGRYVEYDYHDLEWLTKEDYKNAQGTSYIRHDFTYDDDGNRLTMEFDDDSSKISYWADDRDATETTQPSDFGASNQLEKVWTDTTNSKTAGTKMNVGGHYTEDNPQKIEVAAGYDTTWKTDIDAQTIRDGLFIARGVAPYDRSDNKFRVKVTDDEGNASSWAVQITGVDFDDELKEKLWYDDLGNISKREKTFTYDNEGSSTVWTTYYFYDEANRLEYVDLPTGDDEHYVYGPVGNRIAIEYGSLTRSGDEFSSFSATSTEKFVYLGGNVIQEYDDSATPQLEYEYIRGIGLGGGIGSILYQKDVDNSAYRYYHYNHKGDVHSLTDHPADGSDTEELMALYEYDAWGRLIGKAVKANVDNEFLFSTKQHDEVTGLVYFGARYYDPSLARWTQTDVVGVTDELNLYTFVDENPVRYVDSWGRRHKDPIEDPEPYPITGCFADCNRNKPVKQEKVKLTWKLMNYDPKDCICYYTLVWDWTVEQYREWSDGSFDIRSYRCFILFLHGREMRETLAIKVEACECDLAKPAVGGIWVHERKRPAFLWSQFGINL